MAKRMRLINNGQTVELSYHDPYTDADRTRTFWVPSQGGYVRQTTWKRPGTLGLQVCERLDTGGATLTATPDNLAAVIRREYRRMRAQARREMDAMR